MKCPKCNSSDTKVIDTSHGIEMNIVRRRRECVPCGSRFTTVEIAKDDLSILADLDSVIKFIAEETVEIQRRKIAVTRARNKVQKMKNQIYGKDLHREINKKYKEMLEKAQQQETA